MKKPLPCGLAVFCAVVAFGADPAPKTDADGWVPLFDGKTLNGWKANESPETWSVKDGAICAAGPVSHFFYVGPDGKAKFTNFEPKFEARLGKNTNFGVFVRVQWKDKGWLNSGYEAQLENEPVTKCKTGGLWIHAMREQASPVEDEEWFEVHILAVGDTVTVKINGETTCVYEASKEKRKWVKQWDKGTVALQGHGGHHRPCFRNIRIKPLP
jgi:hypothetical protein